jgi:hypothetical protein
MDDTPRAERDHEGWALGIRAVLKGVFGTDTEMRILHGGIHSEIERAKAEVDHMAAETDRLLRKLNGHDKLPYDDTEEAFEAMVRDL